METEIYNPSRQERINTWIKEDLKKSGLNLENFPIETITNDTEIIERLGFTNIKDFSIIDVDGYWIPYPNSDGYYRLKLKEKIGDIKYLSPKGSGNHPYIITSVHEVASTYKPDKTLFFTEGEKKAVKATLEGFPCIGLPGVWCFKDSENDFLHELNILNLKHRKCYICFDSDIIHNVSVRHAELRLAIELTNRGSEVYSLRFSSEVNGKKTGLDDFLINYGKQAFYELIEKAVPTLELQVSEGNDTAYLFKEIARLENEIIKSKILKQIAKRENVDIKSVNTEYSKHLPKDSNKNQTSAENFTKEQLKKAETLLKSDNILQNLTNFTEKIGLIGEEINQKLLYLTFTSRLMDDSISLILKGPSATGKSFLTNTVLRLFPKNEVLNFSYVTSKALVHRQDDLSHKILNIAEHSGSESSQYSIRTLISEGEISIMLPEKNEITGSFKTVEKRIPATGLVFVETTTREKIHAENQTRLFDLYVDDSKAQTEKILLMQAAQKDSLGPGNEEEIKIWQASQTILKKYKVYIPYAQELAESFPKDKIRARRDFPRLLSLIRTHTLLYQFQRKISKDGKLIATIEDLDAILPLIENVLSQTLKELNPKQEQILNVIQKNFEDKEFSVSELLKKANYNVTYRTLQRYCKYFSNDDILDWNGTKGAGSRYTISTNMSLCHNRRIFPSNLLKTLKNKYATPDCHLMEQLTPLRTIILNDDKWLLASLNSNNTSNNNELYQFCLYNVDCAASNNVNDWLFSQ